MWQDNIKAQLLSMQASDRLHHAILFYNSHSETFSDFLFNIGNALTSNTKEYNPDIFRYDEHLDKGTIIPVDAIRNIIEFVYKTSHQNQNKVVIIPKIEKFNNASANAFLKILEEPPKNTYFILSCSNLKNILPTIRSRCYKIRAVEHSQDNLLNNELYDILSSNLLDLNNLNLGTKSGIIDKLKDEHLLILQTLLILLNNTVKNKLKLNNSELNDQNELLTKLNKKYEIDKIFLAIDKVKQDIRFLNQNMHLNKRSSIEGILYTLC